MWEIWLSIFEKQAEELYPLCIDCPSNWVPTSSTESYLSYLSGDFYDFINPSEMCDITRFELAYNLLSESHLILFDT